MRSFVRSLAVMAAIAASAGLAGCGKAKPPNVATAQQLAQRIADKGAGCRDFAANQSAAAAGSTNASSGACTVSGSRVALAVYQSESERDKGQVELLKGCIGRRAVNPSSTDSYAFAKGPTWVVLSTDTAAVDDVGRALHTSVQKSPC